MNLVDRTGTFRGVDIEHSVCETTNGFPQFAVKCQALEYYNEEAEVWEKWDEYAQEITAYMILQSGQGKKDPLWVQQIMKVFGWNGKSYLELQSGDYSDVFFQFRVSENLYQGNTTLQVEWIDEYDAVPGRKLKKLTDEELKALDRKFGKVTAATKKKPKSTPSVKTKAPPKAPAKAKTPAKAPAKKDVVTGCTKDEAWDYLVVNPEMVNPDCTEDQRDNWWLEAIDEIVGSMTEEAAITPSQWLDIRDAVAAKYFKF